MKNVCTLLFFVCCLGILTAGCGKNRFPGIVPGEGTVTFNGSPLADARLLFYPETPREDNVITVARTDQNGRFVMKTNGESDGAYPGNYKVVVVQSVVTGVRKDPETGDDIKEFGLATPRKYSSESTTDLTLTVPERGSRDLVLTLQ